MIFNNKNILTLLVFIPMIINAQTYYQVKYDMKTFFDGPKNYESILSFSGNNSVFKYRIKPEENLETESKDENGNVQINLPDYNVYKIFYNSKAKTLRELKNYSFAQKNALVQDLVALPVWKLHKETKKVNNFLCHKATTTQKGRNYTVWYTLEYATKFGPWKLNGLPGLIISAHDDKKDVFFEAKEIKIMTDKMEEEPNNIKVVNEKEYKKENEKKLNEFSSKINSKQNDRNYKSSISIKSIKGIEIE